MCWRRFYLKPFEAFVGIFVVVNGILTIWPVAEGGSAVRDNLWNLLGLPGLAIPVVQILAGLGKIIGVAFAKANIEAAGLIIIASLFFIRAFSLLTDGDITNSDINNAVIALGIIVCNVIRVHQLTHGLKYVITEPEIQVKVVK